MKKPQKPYNKMITLYKDCNYSTVENILNTLKEHKIEPKDAEIEGYQDWEYNSTRLAFRQPKYNKFEMEKMEAQYEKQLKKYEKWYTDNKDEIEKLKAKRKENKKAKALAIKQKEIDALVNQMNKIKKL